MLYYKKVTMLDKEITIEEVTKAISETNVEVMTYFYPKYLLNVMIYYYQSSLCKIFNHIFTNGKLKSIHVSKTQYTSRQTYLLRQFCKHPSISIN
jgi:hypothetical protein